MTNTAWRPTFVNIFGTLGYISIILQWAWTLIILCYPLITADHSTFLPQPTLHTSAPAMEFGALSPVVIFMAIAFTLLMLVMTVIIVIRLPKTIGISGAKTTHVVAKVIVPAITHRKAIPKKKYMTISYRIILGLKYVLAALPLGLLVFAPTIDALPDNIITFVGIIAAGFTLAYFTVQAILVQILKVDKKKVW
jgi:hypothetical protein